MLSFDGLNVLLILIYLFIFIFIARKSVNLGIDPVNNL